jgi:Skp family chaperone for outer membrane proteins
MTNLLLQHFSRSRLSRRLRARRILHAGIPFEWLALVVLVAGLVGYAARPQAQQAPASRVGTVNLDKVYASIDRYSALQANLKKAGEGLDARVKAAEARVRELEAELDSFQPGSEAQASAVQKLQASVADFRAVEQFVAAKRELELSRAFRETYVAIKDAARRLAERDGYDFVMLDDSVVELDPSNASRTIQQIAARKFIFASPKSDVTDSLVALMNEDWKASRGG